MPKQISNEEAANIRAAIAAGKKIDAIKLYREASGAGLAEAKKFVEALARDLHSAQPISSAMTDADIEAIQAAIFAGERIKAIKLYRAASGEGLREAKEFIEALEEELRRTEPTRFTTPPARRGCGMAVLGVLLCLAILLVAVA